MKNSSKGRASYRIERAADSEQLAAVRALFLEFSQSLDFNLNFQDFEAELANLPGKYAPPSGELLLASSGDTPAGCIAMRSLDDTTCEMKRLWVRPDFRKTGLGRTLAKQIIQVAKGLGYQMMKLDTVAAMKPAIQLYHSLGFVETAPYTFNPLPHALYFELRLK